MPCENYAKILMQNSYWEGFTHGDKVTNLFVWKFFGEILHTSVNFLVNWYDSKVAASSSLYYPKLSDIITPPGYALIGDSAFPKNAASISGKIVRSQQENDANRSPRMSF